MTLVNYAFTSEVKDIFLTDGILWHHFSGFEPGKLSPSKILDIADDELVEIAAYLVQRLDAARYWPDENNVDDLSQKINQIQSSVSSLEKIVNHEISHLARKDQQLLHGKTESDYGAKKVIKDFVKLIDIGNARNTKPSKLKLPDNTIISINYWSEVLRECVKYTLDQNPNLSIPIPDKAGKKVKLLDKQPPQKGVSYVELDYNGENIFLYENYDSNNCIANALYILGKTPLQQVKSKAEVIYD